jgi:hypothetical protein
MRGATLIKVTAFAATALLAAHALAHAAAPAPKVDTAGATSCNLSGYLIATNPKGSDIRAAPAATAAVIGHLPPPKTEPGVVAEEGGEGKLFGADFTVIGSKNGWVLIKAASVGAYSGKERTVFVGPGWLPGDAVGFTIASPVLRTGPRKTDKPVATLRDAVNGYGPDMYPVKRVYACNGGAVDITVVLDPGYDPKAKPMRGWALHVCGAQGGPCGSEDKAE